jgi:hypothetical protein
LKTQQRWYTYGENKEENLRQKNIFLWNAFYDSMVLVKITRYKKE